MAAKSVSEVAARKVSRRPVDQLSIDVRPGEAAPSGDGFGSDPTRDAAAPTAQIPDVRRPGQVEPVTLSEFAESPGVLLPAGRKPVRIGRSANEHQKLWGRHRPAVLVGRRRNARQAPFLAAMQDSNQSADLQGPLHMGAQALPESLRE